MYARLDKVRAVARLAGGAAADVTGGAGVVAAGSGTQLLDSRGVDVGKMRERRRRRRVAALATFVAAIVAYVVWAARSGHALVPLPNADPVLLAAFLPTVLLMVGMVAYYWASGRSPHTVIRPEQIDVRLADVVGIDPVKEEVVRSLNLFLASRTFSREMGGRARRGLLFEGGPGTGKTLLAKAMAAEAGVPFLFATATSFQSSFYGATSRRIRSFFTDLRKQARAEGGAIAFIDEFDAIGGRRSGMEMREAPAAFAIGAGRQGALCCGGLTGLTTVSAAGAETAPGGSTVHPFGTSDLAGPVVNELLVQMQSFEVPVGWRRVAGWLVRGVNVFLPVGKHLTVPAAEPANILVIAATNRADGLDPALLRPGRFDRRLTFELPGKAGRRELVDHFLTRKSHSRKLDDPQFRDALAAVTTGYSPAMVEGLLDEALIGAVRRGRTRMGWKDVESARLAMEVGIGQPFTYTDHERQLVATHEAGHAVIAWLVAPQRRLEVLSIIKRRSSLGLLAHGDRDDVFTRSSSELRALIQIAMGGQSAEELFFGDVSTGPAGDLAYATQVAAQMVGSAGMDSSLVSFEAITAGAFGGTNLVGRVLGDSAGRTAVERLLAEQKAVARNLLDSNRYLVEALRDALIERSELVGPEITKVLEQAAASAPVMSVPALAEPESATMPVQASASVIDLRDSLPGRTHPNA